MSEPNRPNQPSESPKEIARKTLELANFEIGEEVQTPMLYPDKTWNIVLATTTPFYEREVPAVLLEETTTGELLTLTLHDLILNNPNNPKRVTSFAELIKPFEDEIAPNCVGPNLTEGKIIYLRKLDKDGSENKTLFGQITNGPIEVGKVIASTLQPNTYIVIRITFKNERYIIETENGETFIFDKSETIDALETD